MNKHNIDCVKIIYYFMTIVFYCIGLACVPTNPCRNGGTCGENNGIPRCTCVNGYSGSYCELSKFYLNLITTFI